MESPGPGRPRRARDAPVTPSVTAVRLSLSLSGVATADNVRDPRSAGDPDGLPTTKTGLRSRHPRRKLGSVHLWAWDDGRGRVGRMTWEEELFSLLDDLEMQAE